MYGKKKGARRVYNALGLKIVRARKFIHLKTCYLQAYYSKIQKIII